MMRRGARGAESSGVLLARLINARAAVESVRDALEGARAAGSDSVCRRLRLARASLGGVVRHLEGLHIRACEREFKARQVAALTDNGRKGIGAVLADDGGKSWATTSRS